MKTSLTLLALVAASAALTACGGVAPDDVDTTSSELTGVEPDEIDYDDRAGTGGASTSGNTYYVGSANGGIWKTTNGRATATGGAPGTVERAGTAGSSTSGVTYGPVITIKPKG